MKVYFVQGDEWNGIFGDTQLKEFAEQKIMEDSEDFFEKNVGYYHLNPYEQKRIEEVGHALINERKSIREVSDAILILIKLGYVLEEVEVY